MPKNWRTADLSGLTDIDQPAEDDPMVQELVDVAVRRGLAAVRVNHDEHTPQANLDKKRVLDEAAKERRRARRVRERQEQARRVRRSVEVDLERRAHDEERSRQRAVVDYAREHAMRSELAAQSSSAAWGIDQMVNDWAWIGVRDLLSEDVDRRYLEGAYPVISCPLWARGWWLASVGIEE